MKSQVVMFVAVLLLVAIGYLGGGWLRSLVEDVSEYGNPPPMFLLVPVVLWLSAGLLLFPVIGFVDGTIRGRERFATVHWRGAAVAVALCPIAIAIALWSGRALPYVYFGFIVIAFYYGIWLSSRGRRYRSND